MKDAFVFFRSRPEEIEKDGLFAYIHHRSAEKQFSARMLCATLPVSESGFYKWKRNRKKVKTWQKLLAQMHKILEEDEENKNYGVRRMQIALEQRGIKRSLSTVRRVMARGNLLHEDRRSPDGLTKADKKAMRPQNIIKQDFRAQEPLRKLLTDITQILCKDGKLYVSPLLDCYNSEYKKTLGQLHAVQSMSGVGKCWDNARMESWFATLKKEKIYQLDTTKLTVEEVNTIVWRYTFAYYNTKRVTTVNPNGLPPLVYRKTAAKKSAA